MSTGKAIRMSRLVTSMFQVKIGTRNITMPGARRREDRRHQVDGGEDAGEPGEGDADDPEVGARARRVDGFGQRRISEPSEVGRAARGEESRDHHQAAAEVEPVGQGVEPGKGHVRCADLQRHEVVGQPEGEGPGEEEHHDAAVHGEELVVGVAVDDVVVGNGQLGPHDLRQHSGEQEEAERRDHVHARRSSCDRWW